MASERLDGAKKPPKLKNEKGGPLLRLTPAAPPAPAYDWEKDPPAEKGKKKGGGGWAYTVAMIFFGAVFLVSAGLLLHRLYSDRQAEAAFGQLEEMIVPTADPAPAAEGADKAGPAQPEENAQKFARLKAANEDFMGWLSIDGTNLSFPVMYRPDSKDYYLRRDFEGEYSVYGVPYLDEGCGLSPRSENLIIYGHNMKTGVIFGCLPNYADEDYYLAHKQIRFDTVYEDGLYEVWGMFAIDVVNDASFAYNSYTWLDEAAFAELVAQVKARSDVDTGITPVYGDELLTLSTCEYSSANGRYVVCARRVDVS